MFYLVRCSQLYLLQNSGVGEIISFVQSHRRGVHKAIDKTENCWCVGELQRPSKSQIWQGDQHAREASQCILLMRCQVLSVNIGYNYSGTALLALVVSNGLFMSMISVVRWGLANLRLLSCTFLIEGVVDPWGIYNVKSLNWPSKLATHNIHQMLLVIYGIHTIWTNVKMSPFDTGGGHA